MITMRPRYFRLFAATCLLAAAFAAVPAAAQQLEQKPETPPTIEDNDDHFSVLREQDAQRVQGNNFLECATSPFGASLFASGAAPSSGRILSPKQRVVAGDRVALSIWGSIEQDETVPVDSQGFLFVKGVGPIQVAGQTEESLGSHIQREIEKSFRDVRVYARLEQNSGIPVMVTGGVGSPGQYFGSADDSLVVWLQRAGGVLPKQGSYRNIRILRDDTLLVQADLYSFLKDGKINRVAWQAGDVVLVDPPHPQVAVSGDVRRCALFELPAGSGNAVALKEFASPLPGATHAILQGHRNDEPFRQVYDLATLNRVELMDGDHLHFYAAPQSQTITIHVQGPIKGNNVMVVPVHTRLSDVLANIAVNADVSDTGSVFVKRPGVALAQKAALDESLNRLLQSVLTAPAQSDGEAAIRAHEAALVESFVTKVKGVTPEGRVVVMRDGKLNDLPLENGDIVVIPQKTNIISVEGEVVLPRTVVAMPNASIEDYVRMSGGYTERALKNDYIVIRPNGDAIRGGNPEILAGDRVLILPKVDSKGMQTTKDIVQILYQVAVGAGVLLRL